MWALLVQLSIPFFGVLFVIIGVALAGRIVAFSDARKERRRNLIAEQGTSEADSPIMVGLTRKIAVHYPSRALLTSMCITVVKFFYFGTALAAHEYLFSSAQVYTGARFIQSRPYMLQSEARPLVYASIPALLIFDLFIPMAFVYICWSFRRKFKLRSVQIYFGSIFETYNAKCFWWELVNTFRKLSIALCLKAFPATDNVQSALVVSILAGTLMAQVTLNPWRRKIENFADMASSIVLIAALIYTRPNGLAHSEGVIWYIFVMSIAFVAGSVAVIVWQAVTGKTDYEKQLRAYINEAELRTQNQDPLVINPDIEDDWGDMDGRPQE